MAASDCTTCGCIDGNGVMELRDFSESLWFLGLPLAGWRRGKNSPLECMEVEEKG